MIGQLINAKDYTQPLKATVQRTGRLAFTAKTIEELQIRQGTHIFIAPDSESKRILWIGVIQEPNDEAFPAKKSGGYYYLDTTKLFDVIGIDFRKKNCTFNLSRYDENDEAIGGECYKMQLHVTARRNRKTPKKTNKR